MTIATASEGTSRPSSGREAILPYSYAGTMGLLNGSGMDRRFFHRLGASRLDRTICSSAGGAGLTASARRPLRHRARAVRESKLIIAWGANILGTNVHLWPFIVEARRNGAKLLHHRSGHEPHRHGSPTSTFSSIPAATSRSRSD